MASTNRREQLTLIRAMTIGEMLRAGMNVKRIAGRMGLSVWNVYQIAHRVSGGIGKLKESEGVGK